MSVMLAGDKSAGESQGQRGLSYAVQIVVPALVLVVGLWVAWYVARLASTTKLVDDARGSLIQDPSSHCTYGYADETPFNALRPPSPALSRTLFEPSVLDLFGLAQTLPGAVEQLGQRALVLTDYEIARHGGSASPEVAEWLRPEFLRSWAERGREDSGDGELALALLNNAHALGVKLPSGLSELEDQLSRQYRPGGTATCCALVNKIRADVATLGAGALLREDLEPSISKAIGGCSASLLANREVGVQLVKIAATEDDLPRARELLRLAVEHLRRARTLFLDSAMTTGIEGTGGIDLLLAEARYQLARAQYLLDKEAMPRERALLRRVQALEDARSDERLSVTSLFERGFVELRPTKGRALRGVNELSIVLERAKDDYQFHHLLTAFNAGHFADASGLARAAATWTLPGESARLSELQRLRLRSPISVALESYRNKVGFDVEIASARAAVCAACEATLPPRSVSAFVADWWLSEDEDDAIAARTRLCGESMAVEVGEVRNPWATGAPLIDCGPGATGDEEAKDPSPYE